MNHNRLLLLFCAVAASAADLDGRWQLTCTTANGLVRSSVLELKTAEGTLSGSLTSERGSARIENGTAAGDEISFHLLRKGNGDEIDVVYKGRMKEGVLELEMQYGKRKPLPVHGKRL